MKLTMLLGSLLCASLFLMLYAGVALIQDKRFFTTAPKDIQDAIIERKKERFPGARLLGWVLAVVSIISMAAAFIIGARDGMAHNFSFMRFFGRFLTMLVMLKVFDVIVFDYILLCNSHFFQRFYPETEGCEGYSSFGWNFKDHLIQLVLFIPFSLILAWICTIV